MFYKRTQISWIQSFWSWRLKSTWRKDKIVLKSGRVLVWSEDTLQSIFKKSLSIPSILNSMMRKSNSRKDQDHSQRQEFLILSFILAQIYDHEERHSNDDGTSPLILCSCLLLLLIESMILHLRGNKFH